MSKYLHEFNQRYKASAAVLATLGAFGLSGCSVENKSETHLYDSSDASVECSYIDVNPVTVSDGDSLASLIVSEISSPVSSTRFIGYTDFNDKVTLNDTVKSVAAYNGIEDPSLIFPGQTIDMPDYCVVNYPNS